MVDVVMIERPPRGSNLHEAAAAVFPPRAPQHVPRRSGACGRPRTLAESLRRAGPTPGHGRPPRTAGAGAERDLRDQPTAYASAFPTGTSPTPAAASRRSCGCTAPSRPKSSLTGATGHGPRPGLRPEPESLAAIAWDGSSAPPAPRSRRTSWMAVEHRQAWRLAAAWTGDDTDASGDESCWPRRSCRPLSCLHS
jgi:hypothetical protein